MGKEEEKRGKQNLSLIILTKKAMGAMNLKEKDKGELEERMKNCIYPMDWKKGSEKRKGEKTKLNLAQKDRMQKAEGAMNLKVKEEGEEEV